jgi:mediator of RNA polymerase II transcription subunit 20
MRDFTFIAEHVTKTLHGKNTGPWSLSFKVFRDNNQNKRQQLALKDSKLLYQVSLAQQQGHVYCMVDGSVVVEAEKEMEIILSRLKNLWQLRQSVTIEVSFY